MGFSQIIKKGFIFDVNDNTDYHPFLFSEDTFD